MTTRDAATDARDAGSIDAGIRLEVPVDPMAVPPPGSECTGDAGVRAGDPSIAPPRPILPQSVSRVTSQRPSFRWALPEGTTGARVEVCADRCCTRVLQTLDAEGTTVRPTTALPPGVVYWRMFGRRAGVTGSRSSYTWEFGVRRRDTPVDSSWGTIRDFTGDGYDDVLISAGWTMLVAEGGIDGPRVPRAYATLTDPVIVRTGRVGDFNGDGRADFAYKSSPDPLRITLHAVVSAGLSTPRLMRWSLETVPDATLSLPMVTDWNGDGYSDLVTVVYFWPGPGVYPVGSALVVYHGSPTGLASQPQEAFPMPITATRTWSEANDALGDLDLDGYGDVYVIDRLPTGREGSRASILFGGTGGVPRLREATGPSGRTDAAAQAFSQPVAVGDQDGDGREEVAVRWLVRPPVYLYQGSSIVTGSPVPITEPAGGNGGDGFGHDVWGADINGDGLSDLLIASPSSATETWLTTGWPYNTGRMYVYFGGRHGTSTSPIWFDRARPADPNDNPTGFATEIAAPGDLNADGIDDAAIRDLSGGICYVLGRPDLAGAHLSGCRDGLGGGFGVD